MLCLGAGWLGHCLHGMDILGVELDHAFDVYHPAVYHLRSHSTVVSTACILLVCADFDATWAKVWSLSLYQSQESVVPGSFQGVCFNSAFPGT